MPRFDFPAACEYARHEAGQQLENCLAPLVAYCDRQRENEQLSPAAFRHVVAVRQAVDAVLRFDAATEALLAECRQLLVEASELAQSRVPSLNVVVLSQALVHERRLREQLSELCATYAELPPAVYPPDSVVPRLARYLASPGAQAYADLPQATKDALSSFTPADLHAHVERRQAPS